VFDAATRRIIHIIDLVPAFPELETVQAVEMEVTRNGKRAFVAMGRSNQVAEIDPASWKVVRHFPAGQRNWGLALSPDDRRLYAVSGLSGDITILDLGDNQMLRRVKFDGKPWGVEALSR
jgi:YVTN family beta-propeller protein